MACLIMYGSLVPLELRPDALDPRLLLARVQLTPWSGMSPSDVIVNSAIGVPLGFWLMGAFVTGRRLHRVPPSVLVVLSASLSALLGLSVEILQTLMPVRHSSWNDVLAQSSGALCGAIAWPFAGARVVEWLRDLTRECDPRRYVGRVLQLYLPLYVVLQLTPAEFRRSGYVAPEHDLAGVTRTLWDSFAPAALALCHFAGGGLLTFPIGVLATMGWVETGTRRSPEAAVRRGFLVVLAVFTAQVLLPWRHAAVGDVSAALLGVAAGVATATAVSGRRHGDSRRRVEQVRPWILAAAGAWAVVLTAHDWYPFSFAFTQDALQRRLTELSPFPFAWSWYASYRASPWQAVHETVLMFLLAAPLGLLVRLSWPLAADPGARRRQGIAISAGAAALLLLIEIGQLFLPVRLPDVTDALIGALGVLVGCAVGTPFVRQMTSGRACSLPARVHEVTGPSCKRRAS